MVRWLYCYGDGSMFNISLIKKVKVFAVDIGNILVYEQIQTGSIFNFIND